jgi:hypothetical protein
MIELLDTEEDATNAAMTMTHLEEAARHLRKIPGLLGDAQVLEALYRSLYYRFEQSELV